MGKARMALAGDCIGACKSSRTRAVGTETLVDQTPRAVPYVVLHDVDRCSQGAAAVVAAGSNVFEMAPA